MARELAALFDDDGNERVAGAFEAMVQYVKRLRPSSATVQRLVAEILRTGRVPGSDRGPRWPQSPGDRERERMRRERPVYARLPDVLLTDWLAALRERAASIEAVLNERGGEAGRGVGQGG